MKRVAFSFGLLLLAVTSRAEIKFEPVEYQQGDTVLEGLSLYDDATTAKRPGVLVAHQWKGLSAYERKRAEMLARLAAYNENADKRSWEATKQFFAEIFRQ